MNKTDDYFSKIAMHCPHAGCTLGDHCDNQQLAHQIYHEYELVSTSEMYKSDNNLNVYENTKPTVKSVPNKYIA